MRKKLNNKGFTLIELLIVIIIIGILAAIAFVAFSSSTKKAHKADAQSTVASVKTKLGEYSTDNDGNFPVDKTAVVAYLNDTSGGNSPDLATTLGDTGYSYAASPANCDNTTTACSGFTITASASALGFNSPDVTATN
jgi:prepilin-type N-terminal cleavage/methylation domain-containing protein